MDKRRFLLVLQREYYSIVAKKSFILTTLLSPFIMIALIGVPVMLMEFNTGDARTITVIDQSGKYADKFTDSEDFEYQILPDISTSDMKERYEEADGDIYAILVIPADVDDSHIVNIYSEKPVKMSLSREISDVLGKSLSETRINSFDIPGLKEIIAESNITVDVKSHTWDESGESVSSSELATMTGLFLAFLTYMFVLMYGAMIMSSVVEDKTNRIVEVIVSTCRPMELMLGKIISIALVGLTQIAIWTVLLSIGGFLLSIAGIFTASPEIATTAMGVGAGTPMPQMPDGEMPEIIQAILGVNWFRLLGIFVLYFIGGYLLYASLFAAFGSAVDQQSDANQFTMPVMMIIIIALLIGQACMENPDGTLGVICSLIPFTSPIVMMIRLPYDVPAWEIAASIIILYATAILFTWLAARIYRTGILMYGRKVSFKEILRWVK
ncbi:MAG: ABC transporter permease [Muribaculum sp.]|nr:ABC transporter permease [Muribaculum sp.]MDE6457185.1 ABC transporter permease [Muribaculum sp.]